MEVTIKSNNVKLSYILERNSLLDRKKMKSNNKLCNLTDTLKFGSKDYSILLPRTSCYKLNGIPSQF